MPLEDGSSLVSLGPHFRSAASDHHHIELGPGEALTSEWIAAGLTLPDLPRMPLGLVD